MIIGITGGIASGKTVVSEYLRQLGYPIVDADVLAREIMAPGGPVLEEIAQAFGSEMIAADGSLDRQALGRRIFSDESARTTLDAITHPAIRALAETRFREHAGAKAVFFVVPLLYESGMDDLCDEVWLVHADEAVRRARLMARDDIDESYAAQKIASQMSEEERLARGPRVLYNDGDVTHLEAQVKDLVKKL